RSGLTPHVLQHRGGRPAVDLQSVLLLIRAERGACEHSRFSVDLVLVEADRSEPLLHGFYLRSLELFVLAPCPLEWLAAGDAITEMADEEHVEIRKVVVLEHEIIFQRKEGRTVTSLRLQQ